MFYLMKGGLGFMKRRASSPKFLCLRGAALAVTYAASLGAEAVLKVDLS